MKRLLGLDEVLLDQVNATERFLFLQTSRAFLITILFSVIANGYFGWMMSKSISSILLMSLLVGFIHFSVLRIAILTMISLPLVKSNDHAVNPSKLSSAINRIKSTISFSSVVRFIFVCCIAVSVAFPLVSLINFRETDRLNNMKRNEVYQLTIENAGGVEFVPKDLRDELITTNYPFFVFRSWLESSFTILQLILVVLCFFVPFGLLFYIKSNPNFKYAENASNSAFMSIEADYLMTMEECQWIVEKDFPSHVISLKDLSPYLDAPFNSKLKNAKIRQIGTEAEFQQKIRLM
jgi:hypothetical protein